MSLHEFLQRDPACRALAEGALHATAPLHGDSDPDGVLQQLEAWAYTLAGRMPLPWNLHQALDAVNAFLFDELGFRGDAETYDAPENAALPLVIQRRKGLPVALSILWIDLCRRLGLDAVGIALPGHFIVGLRSEPALLCFDPFHGGHAVGEEGAARIVHQASGGRLAFTRDMLRPAPDRAVLVRLVRNLHHRYIQQQDGPNALWTATHLILLEPDEPAVYLDRARVHEQRGDLPAARQDLLAARERTRDPDPQLDVWLKRLS